VSDRTEVANCHSRWFVCSKLIHISPSSLFCIQCDRSFSSVRPPCRSNLSVFSSRGGSTLGQGPGALPQIHLLPPPQIQKLADHSDMISEVPKCSKIHIFRGSAPDPAGVAYSAPPEPLADGRGLAAPSQEPHPALGPSGLVSRV